MRKLLLSAVALAVVASACTNSDDSAASPEEATPPTTLALTRSSGGLTANDDTGFAVREPALIDVLANDTSGDPDNLEIIEVSVPELGEAQVVTYDWPPKVEFVPPPEGDWTQSTFTYTVRDSTGATATALVTVNRPDGDLAAVDDRITIEFDQVGNDTRLDVLQNDPGSFDNNTRFAQDVNPDVFDDEGNLIGQIRAFDREFLFRFETGPDRSPPRSLQIPYTIENDIGGRSTATVTLTIEGLPDAVDDVVAINQGFNVDIDVLANDVFPSGRLEIAEVSEPEWGRVSVSDRINFESGPEPPDGPVTFSYTVRAAEGRFGDFTFTDTATVTLLVNRPPVAVDDTITVNEGSTEQITIDVLANDSDPDGDPLELIDVRSGFGVNLENGVISYRPEPGGPPAFDFEYGVADRGVPGGSRLVATARVMINVNGIEPAPDSYQLEAGSTSVLPVLENDFDPDGDSLTLTGTDDERARVVDGAVELAVPTDACTLTFRYTVADSRGAVDSSDVFVGVVGGQVPPTISVPPLSVSDNAPAGTTIGSFFAGGGCGGTGDRTYRILSGNEDGAFGFNPLSAELSVADPALLDAEVATQRTLTIEFTDAVFTVSTQATVAITNGSAPVLNGVNTDRGFWVHPEGGQLFCLLAQEPGSVDNRAGFATATSAGTVAVTDPDGDPLTFTLSNLNPQQVRRGVDSAVAAGSVGRPPDAELQTSPIEIDPATGELRRNGSGEFLFWAYRTRAPFTYTVTVSDGVFTVEGTLVVIVSEAC